jgi:uncharacterized lipoprotein
MTHYLRLIATLLLVAALAACNSSDGSAENDDDGQTAGDGLNPTAIASELAPPTGGQLPAELRPPS